MTKIVLISTLLIIMLAVACNSMGNATLDATPLWFVDHRGVFHTYNIEKAQAQIPFRIILPTYFPPDLSTDPLFEGLMEETQPEASVGIRVKYREVVGGSYLIRINESNWTATILPSSESTSRYLDIQDTEVLVNETDGAMTEDGWESHPALSFWWKKNGVLFHVTIGKYTEDEAIKIIKSMIDQE